MLRFILKRLLWFIPMLLLISAIAFVLKVNAPGNPVNNSFGMSGVLDGNSRQDIEAYEKAYKEKYQSMGLHMPGFYFSFTTAVHPSAIRQIPFDLERKATLNWAYEYHNPKDALALNQVLNQIKTKFYQNEKTVKAISVIDALLICPNKDAFSAILVKDSLLKQNHLATINAHISELTENGNPHLSYWPSFRWHGADNQYHYWLMKLLQGDWGKSYHDGQPVFKKIKEASSVSFVLGLIVLLFTFLVGVALGVLGAQQEGGLLDNSLSLLAFSSFAIPTFLVATLASVFLTTPEYGNWLDWFPTIGMGQEKHHNFLGFVLDRGYHLALPVLCISFGLYALIQQQTRNLMVQVLNESEYIKTARTKGLSEKAVLWKHAFRNILLPLITLFTGLIPALLTGIVAIEYIFNLPGFGRLMIESLQTLDWPVVLGILIISILAVLFSYLLADVLYVFADPRVRFKNGKS